MNLKINMNDLMDLWGEDQPAEPIDAEKLTREVLKKAEKDARPRKKRRIILIAAVAAIVAVMGGTAVAASAGKLHFEKVEGVQMQVNFYDKEQDTMIETEIVNTEFDAVIHYESEETEKETASAEETSSETETETVPEGYTVAMKVGYLPHELTGKNSVVTLKDLLETEGDTSCTMPEEEQRKLYIEINDLYFSDPFTEKEAAKAAELIGLLAGGYDEATREKAVEAIMAFHEAQNAGAEYPNETDEEFFARMDPYVDAVMALPGLTKDMEDTVFTIIAEAPQNIYNIHVYAKPDAEEKSFLVRGNGTELVWEKELFGMDAMLVSTYVASTQIEEALFLYNMEKSCIVMITGTIGEEEMLKIAESIELVETDAPAYSRMANDWGYASAALG